MDRCQQSAPSTTGCPERKLVRRSNGTRIVSVAVPRGQEIQFRYLAAGGHWFDDEDAHAITPEGSLVRS